MNRADRRRLVRLQEKAGNSMDDFTKFITEANRLSDESLPLHYTAGFVHAHCGGPAERPSNFGAGAYCSVCGRTVPSEQTVPQSVWDEMTDRA